MLGVGGGARAGVADGVKTLGGLVMNTTKVKVNDKTVPEKRSCATEHGCFGKNATKYPMARGGPYPGYFGTNIGKAL
jgi:hypothetical protein